MCSWVHSFRVPATAGCMLSKAVHVRVQGASNWLFPFVNGAPPIGWHDASAYLVLPVLLVVSQYVSQKVSTGGQCLCALPCSLCTTMVA